MNVLFLVSTVNSKSRYHPGVASLSAFLRQGGHATGFFDLSTPDCTPLLETLRNDTPAVLAVSTNSHQYAYIKHVVAQVKERFPEIKVLIGGTHPRIDYTVIDDCVGADAVCKGEGEGPLLEYVDALAGKKERVDIANMDIRSDGQIYRNAVSYFVRDLDTLPFPDYSIFPLFRRGERLSFPIRFLFNRGCPYLCTYCCNHKLQAAFPEPGKYVRFKSPKRVVEEIAWFADMYGFGHYVVDDDIFTLNKKWLLEFCSLYPEKLKTKTFEVNVRVGTADFEMFKALYDVGCRLVKIGLESGDEQLRSEVLGRNMKQDALIETAGMIHRAGLKLHTFNMIGLPGERRDQFWKTIALNRRLRPQKVQLTVFYPYKNTVLGEKCYRENYVAKERADTYFTESVMKTDVMRFSGAEIWLYTYLFKFLVFVGIDGKTAMRELRHATRNLWMTALQTLRGVFARGGEAG